jgi:hypothetical protein
MRKEQLHELLYPALETEVGGRDVKAVIGAARAKQARTEML